MQIIETGIEGLVVIEPKIFGDDRGYFFESYNQQAFAKSYREIQFVQDNEAYSKYGVVRGLHYQLSPKAQSKLVRVVQGEVLDVVVDIRPKSKTFGQHFSIRLSAKNKKQVFVPHGMAHGYAVLSEESIFCYKCDHFYDQSLEHGIHLLDSDLNIDWGIPQNKMIISDKDLKQPTFNQHKTFH